MASVFLLLEAFNRKEAAALGFFPCATASFCIGFVSGRIFKTPVHRHFDGILRDAPHPLGSPTFYHAPAKISNKLAKLQNFVHNCKKRPGA